MIPPEYIFIRDFINLGVPNTNPNINATRMIYSDYKIISSKNLYFSYTIWCKENKLEQINLKSFSRSIKNVMASPTEKKATKNITQTGQKKKSTESSWNLTDENEVKRLLEIQTL